MSYQSGLRITAANISFFYSQVLRVYGVGSGDYGYGQTALTLSNPTLIPNQPISGADMQALFSAITLLANHQGVDPNPTYGITPATGTIVQASSTLFSTVAALATNRLSKAASMAQTTSGVQTAVNGVTWANQSITTTFTATFTTEDAARFFFNQGGTINLRLSHPQGVGGPDVEWTYALGTNVGTIAFGAHGVTNAGDVANGTQTIGYYELADDPIEVLGITGIANNALFSNNVISLTMTAARLNFTGTNGANGTGIQFVLTLSDDYDATLVSAGTTLAVDLVGCTDLTSTGAPTISTPIWLLAPLAS